LRLDALLTARLVVPGEPGSSTGGRRPAAFTFNSQRGVLLIADMGATGIRIAVCDLAGTVLREQQQAIDIADGPEPLLTSVSATFASLLRDTAHEAADVLGIGLAVPGPVDFAGGRVVSPPIMTGWDRFDIRGWFASSYGCPVIVEKDTNAMAVGERLWTFPDVADLMMLKVGTGVGSGLIANGTVYRGADGAAGDIGHIQLTLPDDDGDQPACRCGNHGCVEAYAGGWAMARDLRAAGKHVDGVNDVLALLQTGDPTAQQLLRRAGRILGRAIADAVNLFNPRVISVGGQFSRTDEQLLAGMREVVYQRSLPLATRNLQIARSRLEPRAGLLGLSALLSDEIFSAERLDQLMSS
jgi:predicted NBD/HSP70 family sugar kinase